MIPLEFFARLTNFGKPRASGDDPAGAYTGNFREA